MEFDQESLIERADKLYDLAKHIVFFIDFNQICIKNPKVAIKYHVRKTSKELEEENKTLDGLLQYIIKERHNIVKECHKED